MWPFLIDKLSITDVKGRNMCNFGRNGRIFNRLPVKKVTFFEVLLGLS